VAVPTAPVVQVQVSQRAPRVAKAVSTVDETVVENVEEVPQSGQVSVYSEVCVTD
jgi:hypothetical protein